MRIRRAKGREETRPWTNEELEEFGRIDSWTEWFIKKKASIYSLLHEPKRWCEGALQSYGEFFDKDEEIKMFKRIFSFDELCNFLQTHAQYLPELKYFRNQAEWKYFWNNSEKTLDVSTMSRESFKLWKKTLLTPNGTSPALVDVDWGAVFETAKFTSKTRFSYGAEYLVRTSATVVS